MRFLVGTLYSGENEFPRSKESLWEQTHDSFDHRVFRHLGHREAHERLYSCFMEQGDRYDALVKLDADMVLRSPTFLSDLEEFLRARQEVLDLEIAVDDFFTDRMVWGLHVYRQGVQWEFDEEGLFVDRSPVAARHHFYDASELAPAATHSPDPSLQQCLMWGLKRGLKAIQWPREERPESLVHLVGWWSWERIVRGLEIAQSPAESEVECRVLASHWETYRSLEERAATVEDRRLQWALLGFECGMSGEFRESDVSYRSDSFRALLSEVESGSPETIQERIRQRRRRNAGFLPQFLRRKILRARHYLSEDPG